MNMNKTFIIFLSLFCGISSFGHSEARYLDVLYGARFTGMDPLAEESPEVSPYAYCRNNFVNRIDPDGKDDYYSYAGQFLFRDNKTTDNIIIRNEFLYHMKQISGAEWLQTDYPIQNVTLSAEAYSNIFTDVLNREHFNLNHLANNKISVIVLDWSNQNYKYSIKDVFMHERVVPWKDAPIAETRNIGGDIRVSAYVYPEGDDDRKYLSTVSNVVSILGVHEYKGHGLLKMKEADHWRILNMQRTHPSWKMASEQLKDLYLYFESINLNGYGK